MLPDPAANARELVMREDWILTPSRRIDRTVNQRRILAAWRTLVGPIDYSNGYAPRDTPAAQ